MAETEISPKISGIQTKSASAFSIIQWLRQCRNYFIHDRNAGDRILSQQIPAAYSGRLLRDRMRNKSKTHIGHASLYGELLHEIRKFLGDNGGRRHPQTFNGSRMDDDRRRTAASMANGHDHAMAVFLDFPPKLGIIVKVAAGLHFDYPLRFGILLLKYLADLFYKRPGIGIAHIHYIDGFAF